MEEAILMRRWMVTAVVVAATVLGVAAGGSVGAVTAGGKPMPAVIEAGGKPTPL